MPVKTAHFYQIAQRELIGTHFAVKTRQHNNYNQLDQF